jgi:hypothetical protein
MKLFACIGLVIASVLLGPAIAAGQTPTLEVTTSCLGGPENPEFTATVSGLPPGAGFLGGFELVNSSGGGTGASSLFTADESGAFEITLSFIGPLERLTLFVEFQGTRVVQNLIRPCQLPATTEDCKNDGWRNFGVFRNQGDCVSYVATGGKNPPGKR